MKIVSMLFSPENFVLRDIDCETITCSELFEHFETHVKMLKVGEHPSSNFFLCNMIFKIFSPNSNPIDSCRPQPIRMS